MTLCGAAPLDVGRRTTRTQVQASLTMITLRRGVAIAHGQVPRQLRPAGHRILSLQPVATVVGGIGASTGTDCGLERISGPSVTLDAAVEASGEGQNRLSDRRATQRVFRVRVLDFARTRLGMAAPPGDRATVCRARG